MLACEGRNIAEEQQQSGWAEVLMIAAAVYVIITASNIPWYNSYELFPSERTNAAGDGNLCKPMHVDQAPSVHMHDDECQKVWRHLAEKFNSANHTPFHGTETLCPYPSHVQ